LALTTAFVATGFAFASAFFAKGLALTSAFVATGFAFTATFALALGSGRVRQH
jgi:hypothetical protein